MVTCPSKEQCFGLFSDNTTFWLHVDTYVSLFPTSSVFSSGSKEESPLFPVAESVGSDLAHNPDAERGL